MSNRRSSCLLIRAAGTCAVCLLAGSTFGQTLFAHPGPANNGGSILWAIFFDLTASANPVIVTHMSTASQAPAGVSVTVEVYTRAGSALGGPVGSGPGSSPSGWIGGGTAVFTQGAIGSGVSIVSDIPDIQVPASSTVGVALHFFDFGPRYFGEGSPPYSVYTDGNLTLVTGDARSQPFTTGGSWFASRELVGQIDYVVVPEPASILALAGGAALLLLRRRK